MKQIAKLLYEARMLKEIPRSGYGFLGAGKESVAEHTFITSFIACIMSRLAPEVDPLKLITMCLVHDMAEARTGDLNTVQKKYVVADEGRAISDAERESGLGGFMSDLLREFREGETPEARLANDADQLSFILDLKVLAEIGYRPPRKWLPAVVDRLKTETGREICEGVMETGWDEWWRENL
ncbi:MAG: HD domain-containing protein [Desulfobacterales bacterium]|nr:HD domain-containing protein [Desulfobacterales bacterium]